MTLTRKRYLFGLPLLAAVLLVVIGNWSLRAVHGTIKAQLAADLKTTLDANVTALEIWVSNQERLAGLLANDPALRTLALELLAASAGREQDRARLGALPQQAQFQRLLGDKVRAAGYGMAELVSTNLNIIGASGRMGPRLGAAVAETMTERYQAVFASGKTVLITPFKAGRPRGSGGPGGAGRRAGGGDFPEPPPGEGRFSPDRPPGDGPPPEGAGRFGPPRGPGGTNAFGGPRGQLNLMQVVAPVRDDAGTVVGALACVVRPEQEFTRVLSVARSGETGETFAFDVTGLLISQSRFDEQLRTFGLLTNAPEVTSSLNLTLRDPGVDLTHGAKVDPAVLAARPLMTMVADAVAGGSGVQVEDSPDYRGVKVVGAWRWLPDLNFGVLTKMDSLEAYKPLVVLVMIFAALFGLLALFTVITLIVVYVNAKWRRKFSEAALKARQLGQYTLDGKIGEGAMGVVYRAHHALLRRETAVKLLLPDRADPDLVKQFEHEVRLTCQLTHPNTIQIYDYGRTADDIFYYAMELLRGFTLQDLIERHGAQPEARVIHLLAQVCGSLQEAHAAGLIHRDIKPGNLFLCERGGIPDTVKVLDFGLVGRVAGETETVVKNAERPDTSRFLGTPHYMSPECIRQAGFGDARSDIYALGVVAYVLLTGEPLFDGEDHTEIWQKHLNAAPLPPSVRSPRTVSRELEQLVLRCLAKEPADRPQTVAELAAALRACPVSEPWTLAEAQAWWAKFGPGSGPATAPAKPRSRAEATLRINFTGRTSTPPA